MCYFIILLLCQCSYPDLYHYLINSTSFVTKEEVKNYKSLTAYKYFIDGWILGTWWKKFGDVFLVLGKVRHSYAASSSPLIPWVAARMNGSVEYGHCTCMAGLGETCSHIASFLYWLETAVRIRSSTTCTSVPNSWLPPSLPAACKEVPYVTLEELEKISQRQHKMQPVSKKWETTSKQVATDEEMTEFYLSLSNAPNRKPAILSVVPYFSDRFAHSFQHLPTPLQGIYQPENDSLNYLELLEKAKSVSHEAILESQVKHLEVLTRGQSTNRQWFKYRAGRITASQLYHVSA